MVIACRDVLLRFDRPVSGPDGLPVDQANGRALWAMQRMHPREVAGTQHGTRLPGSSPFPGAVARMRRYARDAAIP